MERATSHPTPLRRAATLMAAGIAAMTLAAGCTPGAGDLGSVAPPPGSTTPSLDIPSPEPTPGSSGPTGSPGASPGETTTLRAYFVLGSFTGDGGLVPVVREVAVTQAVGAAAMTQLLAGPVGDELSASPAMYSAVPDGTRFLGLTIAGGIATVNLSSEFGTGGGSETIVARYAQIVFTLTQFPTVKGVRFELDGVAAPAIITGATVADAVTRTEYADQLPAIWVDRPAWGGVLANPGRVTGLADVFEAQFRLMVLDAEGRALVDAPVLASCGTGCLGSFDVTIPYSVSTAQWGTLRVFEPSAKDGSPIHVVDYPVWLTP